MPVASTAAGAVNATKGSTTLGTTRHGSADDAEYLKVGGGVERGTGTRRRSGKKGGDGAAGAGGAAALLSDQEIASPGSAQAAPAGERRNTVRSHADLLKNR